MAIKIRLWFTEIKSRHLCLNENDLHHSWTKNMKNKNLPSFITYFTLSRAKKSTYKSELTNYVKQIPLDTQ